MHPSFEKSLFQSSHQLFVEKRVQFLCSVWCFEQQREIRNRRSERFFLRNCQILVRCFLCCFQLDSFTIDCSIWFFWSKTPENWAKKRSSHASGVCSLEEAIYSGRKLVHDSGTCKGTRGVSLFPDARLLFLAPNDARFPDHRTPVHFLPRLEWCGLQDKAALSSTTTVSYEKLFFSRHGHVLVSRNRTQCYLFTVYIKRKQEPRS